MSKADTVWTGATALSHLWMSAKYYLLWGIGYLFARDAKTGLRVSWGILRYWVPQQFKDARYIGGVIWREWARPVIARDLRLLGAAGKKAGEQAVAEAVLAGRQQAAWGSIGVTAGANVLVLGMGGGLVESIDTGWDYIQERMGWESPFDEGITA